MKLSRRKLQRDSHVELSMTSMIDVVFLLLIFFMTTSNFVRTERNLDPAIKVNQSSSGESKDLEPLIVEVVRDGDASVYRIGGRTMATRAELEDVLRSLPPTGDGAFVRVANDVPFGMAAAAIQACKSTDQLMVSYVPMEGP